MNSNNQTTKTVSSFRHFVTCDCCGFRERVTSREFNQEWMKTEVYSVCGTCWLVTQLAWNVAA